MCNRTLKIIANVILVVLFVVQSYMAFVYLNQERDEDDKLAEAFELGFVITLLFPITMVEVDLYRLIIYRLSYKSEVKRSKMLVISCILSFFMLISLCLCNWINVYCEIPIFISFSVYIIWRFSCGIYWVFHDYLVTLKK